MIKFKNGIINITNSKIEKTYFGVKITFKRGGSIEFSDKVWESLIIANK